MSASRTPMDAMTWLELVGLLSGRPPVGKEARAMLLAYASALPSLPADAFCHASAVAVAEDACGWPPLGVLAKSLRSWWKIHAPRFVELAAPRPAPIPEPDAEQLAQVHAAVSQALAALHRAPAPTPRR